MSSFFFLILFTLCSKILGSIRYLAFSHYVINVNKSASTNALCIADAYNLINQIPNIIFDVLASGSITYFFVSVLMKKMHSSDIQERNNGVRLFFLVCIYALSISIVIAFISDILIHQFNIFYIPKNCINTPYHYIIYRLSYIFMLQIPLYMIFILASIILQANIKLSIMAIGSIISNIITISTYIAFHYLYNTNIILAIQILAYGTTLGVFILTLWNIILLFIYKIYPKISCFHYKKSKSNNNILVPFIFIVLSNFIQQSALIEVNLFTNRFIDSPGTYTIYILSSIIYILPVTVIIISLLNMVIAKLSLVNTKYKESFVAYSWSVILLISCYLSGLIISFDKILAKIFLPSYTELLSNSLIYFGISIIGYSIILYVNRILYIYSLYRQNAIIIALPWLLIMLLNISIIFVNKDQLFLLSIINAIAMSMGGFYASSYLICKFMVAKYINLYKVIYTFIIVLLIPTITSYILSHYLFDMGINLILNILITFITFTLLYITLLYILLGKIYCFSMVKRMLVLMHYSKKNGS